MLAKLSGLEAVALIKLHGEYPQSALVKKELLKYFPNLAHGVETCQRNPGSPDRDVTIFSRKTSR